jgi:serine/threonine protein phosphatase PrpC
MSKVVERHGHHHLSAAVCSVNGYRMNMEDAHCMHTSKPELIGNVHSTFGVFDGHINDTAAKYVAERMPRAIERLPRPLCKTSLEGTFIDIDSRYLEDDRDGGTTGTVAIIEPITAATFQCTVCNLGDSRVIVIRKGELLFVTKDHKPSDPVEQARIEAAGGRVELERVNGDLALSRAFGDGRYKAGSLGPDKEIVSCIPDVYTIELVPDDIVLLCCDGVFEAWSTEEVVQFVHALNSDPTMSLDLAVIAAAVCENAVLRGSKDNVTCMIVKMSAAGIDALSRYGTRSYVPMCPPLAKADRPARLQYEAMARAAGVTVVEALMRRYELVTNRTALVPPRFSDLEARTAFINMNQQDIAAEQLFFGSGPPLEANEEQRIKWFETLWRNPAEPEGSTPGGGKRKSLIPGSDFFDDF